MNVRPSVPTRLAAVLLSAALVVALAAVTPAGASAKGAKRSAQAKELTTLAKKIKHGKKATYLAVFAFGQTGKTSTVTFAQKPPKTYFKETTETLIDTGTESLTCSPTTTGGSASTSTTGSGTSSATSTTPSATTSTTTTTTAPKYKVVCLKEPASEGALGGLLDLFSPTTALDYFNTAEESIAAKLAGYSVKFTTGSYGGLSAKCVTLRISGATYRYCVASNGLLAYSGTAKGYFELKSFSKSPPASDFAVPADARIESTP
jgi:hypothetical protein